MLTNPLDCIMDWLMALLEPLKLKDVLEKEMQAVGCAAETPHMRVLLTNDVPCCCHRRLIVCDNCDDVFAANTCDRRVDLCANELRILRLPPSPKKRN
jgi:hypothetical protein